MKKRYIVLNAPVVLTFVLICLGALIANRLTGGWANSNLFSVYHCSLKGLLPYVRFIGHVFGHASWTHFFNNMLYILLLGPAIEEKYGSGIMSLVILLTALVTGIVQFVFFPTTALLGASGIVFMLIVFSSFTSFKKNEIPLTAVLVFALYVGQEVYSAIALTDSVSQLTHIIGGILGLVFGLAFRGDARVRRS